MCVLGVTRVILGPTRYHRVRNRVLVCKKVVENDYQNHLGGALLVRSPLISM
jgi:hypothetical protein